MAMELAGGVQVRPLREGPLFDQSTGTKDITLRCLQIKNRARFDGGNCDEVVYVFDGAGSLFLDGRAHALTADTGFYVKPGAAYEIEASSALTLVSSRCPSSASENRFSRLEDCESETTGDRWYKVVLEGMVTQFVGAIPPGRAPDHFHEYEEVLCILSGRGRMHAGDTSTPIERGSCIYLPRRQVHCVENTGAGELKLLGVFYPAGSPAVRYSTRG